MSQSLDKKKNRGSNWMNPDNGTDTQEADTQRILKDAMARSALFNPNTGHPLKYSVEEVQERIEGYFIDCADKGRRPTLTGLCVALDIVPDTLRDWTADRNKPYYTTINRARLLIQEFEENMVLEGKTNVIYGIFRDKTRWGYYEKSALEVTPGPQQDNSYGDFEDAKAYVNRIRASLPPMDDDYEAQEGNAND